MPSSFKRWLNSTVSRWPRAVGTVVILCSVLVLSACSEDFDQRAVQPGQVAISASQTSIPAYAQPSSLASPSAIGTAATPATAVNSSPNGSTAANVPMAEWIYFTRGGDLWQIPAQSGNPAPVLAGHNILAYAPSPDGSQVAVIYLSTDKNEEHLADLKSDGSSVVDVALKIPSDDKGDRGGDIQSIAWSPNGNLVAVARQDGSISTVTKDGTISQIVPPDAKRFAGALSISPDGSTLLFLDPALPDRSTSLYSVSLNGGTVHKLVDGGSTGEPVMSATWLPNSRIAYVQKAASSPTGTGDLFIIDTTTAKNRLVVAAAQFAPVAGVANAVFSRDGHWAAFTIYVPSNAGSQFYGLWLLDVQSGSMRQITVNAGDAVTDLWWGKETLIYRTIAAASAIQPQRYTGIEPFSLYSLSPSGGKPVLRQSTS